MKHFVFGLIGAFLLISFSVPAAATTSPNFTWTGFYIGVNGGGELGKTYWGYTPVINSLSHRDHDTSGGLLGGTLGYNMQMGQWVYGVEADMDWSNFWGDRACPNASFRCQSDVRGFGTIRARAGYDFRDVVPSYVDHLFTYFTAGTALGVMRIQTASTTAGGTTTKNPIGWTVGAGAEYPITDNIISKAEYLYYSLPEDTYTVDGGNHVRAYNWGSIVRTGFAYKF